MKTALENGTTKKKFRKLRGSYLLYDGKVRPKRNASKKESPEKKERKVKKQKKEGDGKERKAKKAVEKEETKKNERKKKEVKEKKERKKKVQKEDDGRKKKAAKNDGRAKKVRKPKNTGKEEEDAKEVCLNHNQVKILITNRLLLREEKYPMCSQLELHSIQLNIQRSERM